MYPSKTPIIPGMTVRHDPEGGLKYRVDKVSESTDDYETEHALNGLRRVAYTQLEDGSRPAGTEWDKDETQFRANFTPIDLEGEEDTKHNGYRVIQGSEAPIRVHIGAIHMETRSGEYRPGDPMPGVRYRGVYASREGNREIVSFLYHKTDPITGELETAERLVIQEGLGYGVHPGHIGQPPSWYIVGPQIGTVDPSTDKINLHPLISSATDGHSIDVKHFSIACIADNPVCEPLLADTKH